MADGEAPDSINVLDALLGRDPLGRADLVVEGMQAKTVVRSGSWTYIPPYAGPAMSTYTHTELGNAAEPQLYDLSQDIGQIRNIAAERPEVVAELATRLAEVVSSERTR